MNKDNSINYNYFDKVKINGHQCTIDKDGRYFIDSDGFLKKNENHNDLIVMQVEFVLRIDDKSSNIAECIINMVEYDKSKISDSIKTFTFKNSVVFTKDNNIPYRYSGNIGYLNGYPLKIYIQDKNKVYNEFYIIGRKNDGYCRKKEVGSDILEYLFFSDKPLLFNEDYTYSCKLPANTNLKDTILYQKLNNIEFVAKYGSSDYNKVEGNEDWIKVTKTNFEDSFADVSNKNFNIEMNIKFKTDKKKGFYSHKYINDVSIRGAEQSNCNNGDCLVKLEIKFSGDDETNDTRYKKIPDRPFFIPNIPDDILDPLINPDVDK
jgi:hypothetical protein